MKPRPVDLRRHLEFTAHVLVTKCFPSERTARLPLLGASWPPGNCDPMLIVASGVER